MQECSMEQDGSRAAADLSHEGPFGSGIEVSREEQGSILYGMACAAFRKARNSLSLVRRNCTEHRFGKLGGLHCEPADKRRADGRSASRIPASDRDLLPSPAHFSHITSVPEFSVVV